MKVRASEVDSDSCWYERPEDVAEFGRRAGAAEADPEEMERMNTLPPTFAVWLDTPSDQMSIVIICW